MFSRLLVSRTATSSLLVAKHGGQSTTRFMVSPSLFHVYYLLRNNPKATTYRSSFATATATATALEDRQDIDDDDDDEQMLLSPANRKNLLTVAILGPPNAGKSTLFNRFIDKKVNKTYRLAVERDRRKAARTRSGRLASSRHGKSKKQTSMLPHATAIVSSVPGTTRDRRECIGRIGGTYFRLIDTAGVDGERLDCYNTWQQKQQTSKRRRRQQKQNHNNDNDPDSEMVQAMMRQTSEAALQADLILLIFDARVGVTSDLLETARWLRRNRLKGNNNNKNSIVVLANKLEGIHWDYDGSPVLDNLTEATRVGFGEVIPISAIHGEGMADIAVLIEESQRVKLEELSDNNDDDNEKDHEGASSNDAPKVEKPLQLAILGRQNVGKSTLVNALLKQERVITGASPGLTRDAISVEWSWNGRPVKLVDTAGIRKRSQRDHSSDIEDMAVEDAMRAMKVADVAVLVLDAEAGMLQRQELVIADAVLKEGRSLVVVANKMDLIVEDDYTREDFTKAVREQLEGRFPMLRKTPVIAMSSLYGDAVDELMPVVFNARDRWARTISTGQLNGWMIEVVHGNPPPPVAGKPVRIKYLIQTKGRPPTFLLFCNVDTLPDHYLRYLTKNFQDTFEMYGMELRFAVKKSSSNNPYEPSRTRSGSGLGGRQARKERMVKLLKKTGSPDQRRRRSRRKNRYT